MKITYFDATKTTSNSPSNKLGLKEVDVDIIGDYGYKIHGHIIDVCDLEVED